MASDKMHVDELEIKEALVRRLLVEQFPHWADLPLRRVEPDGTVNAVFRLGDELCVRLARREGPTRPGGKEFDWLSRLAPWLPLEVPVPVALGRPNSAYPWFWTICTWLDGESVPVAEIDAVQAARDLADFVAALQRVDPSGGPVGRNLSTRKFELLVEQLVVAVMSKSQFSLLCACLYCQVSAFRTRPLESRYPYLSLYAKVERVREPRGVRHKALVIAYCVHESAAARCSASTSARLKPRASSATSCAASSPVASVAC